VPKSWPHLRVRSLSRGGPGNHCRYPVDQIPPRISSKSRRRARCALSHAHMSMTSDYATWHGQLRCYHTSCGTSSGLLARAARVPPRVPWPQLPSSGLGQLGCCHASRGASSRLLAQDSSGAATCPMAPAPASWLRAAPKPPRVPWSSMSCGLLSKQIPPGGIAIMISHRGMRVSSRTPDDKVDTARMRDMQRETH
jgi:hypothetical protein